MKTIQQCFIEANIDDLVTQYIFAHPLTITDATDFDQSLTVYEHFELYKSNIYSLIRKIRNIELKPDTEDRWIFFVHHHVEADFRDVTVSLVKESELLDPECFTMSYAYEFSHIEETAAFYVSDTYLTQYYLQDVLIDYLYESSFFGFNQEYLDEHIDELAEKAEYVNEHLDELLETAKESKYKISFELEKRDEEECKAWDTYLTQEIAYCKKCFEIEEKKVIALLEDN